MAADELRTVRQAARKAVLASEERDEAIRLAHAVGGLSIRKIAVAAGLSHQRVHQIVHGR